MGIIARQGIKASIAGFIGVAIGAFSRLFLYTNFLSVSEIGTLETLIKLGVLISPFFVFGGAHVITKYHQKFNKERTDFGLISTYLFLLSLLIIPLSSIIYLGSKKFIFSLYIEAPHLEIYYLIPLIVAISLAGYSLMRAIATVCMRITVPTIINGIIDRVLIIILLIVYGYWHLINFSQFLYLNVILFYGVPFVLVAFYAFSVLKIKFEKVDLSERLSILKKTAYYNLYLVFGSLSTVIISAIDISMISGKLGTELAGVYVIAFFIGTVIEIPRRSLGNIIYPILSTAILQKDVQKIKTLYQKASINQFLVGAFIFLVVWLNIDSIFEIIPNGNQYQGGKLVVLFIGLSKLVDMGMGVNKEIIELSKYYRYNLFLNILLSIMVIVLNLIFITLDSKIFGGINGVAFASLLALVIHNITTGLVVWFKEGIHPFTSKHLSVFVLISIAYLATYFVTFTNPFISIFIKCFVLLIVFVSLTLALNISEDFKKIFNDLKNKLK